jgi:hypothetical protein
VQGGKLVSQNDDGLDVLNKQLPFSALPPMWVSCGEFEVFKDDIIEFCKELESHETHVEFEFGVSAPHIFPMLFPLFPEQSRVGLESAARFCVECWGKAKLEALRLEQMSSKEEKLRVSKLKRDLSLTDVGELFSHFFEKNGTRMI